MYTFRKIESLIEKIHKGTNVLEHCNNEETKHKEELEKQLLEMDLFDATLKQFLDENASGLNKDQFVINHPRPWLFGNDEKLIRTFESLTEGIIVNVKIALKTSFTLNVFCNTRLLRIITENVSSFLQNIFLSPSEEKKLFVTGKTYHLTQQTFMISTLE